MYKILLITLLSGSLFLGCSASSQTANLEVAQESSSQNLEGTTWKLGSFGLNRMAVPKDATLILKDGKYSGHGGCNGVGGNYTLNGEKLSFSAGFSTMMACPELDLEHKYMQALTHVDSYKVKGEVLDLQAQGRSVLRFKAVQK